MVRILTKDYTELDLTKGFEFQLELDNPMLEDDHLPQAFSTQISFPPSPTNRKVFGYLPAMFLAPSVRTLDVTIWVGGVPFVSGSLAYDGVEDGNLMYTFTQAMPDLDGKIWSVAIESFDYRRGIPEDYKSAAPLLVNEVNVAVQPYSKVSRRPVEGEPGYSATSADGTVDEGDYLYRDKYFNYTNASEGFDYIHFIPAVPLNVILKGCAVEIPESLLNPDDSPGVLAILGRYHEYLFDNVAKPSSTRQRAGGIATSSIGKKRRYAPRTGKPYRTTDADGAESYQTDVASFLPDVTFSDLVKNLCSVFCATIFNDHGVAKLVTNADVLASAASDWSDKVSSDFSAEVEEAMSYRFGYASEDSEALESLEKKIEDGTVETMKEGDISGILGHFTSAEDYTTVFDTATGDVYSGRKYDAVVNKYYETYQGKQYERQTTETAYECDVILQGAKELANEIEDADEVDNSSDFYLAKCVPEVVIYSDSSRRNMMAAVVPANKAGDDRDSKVYLGQLYAGQFISNGVFAPLTKSDGQFVGNGSLTPDALWPAYHEAFAEWIGRERQRVTADVDLSPVDLAAFKLDRPVYFHGRRWIVAKLSVTASAGSEIVTSRAEFIEL